MKIKNKYSVGSLLNKNNRWLRHLLFLFFINFKVSLSIIGLNEPLGIPFLNYFLLYLLPDLILIYCSVLILVPKFLLKGRTVLCCILTITLILLYSGYTYFIGLRTGDITAVEKLVPFTTFLKWYAYEGIELTAQAVGAKLFLQYVNDLKRMQELKNKNISTELLYLKNQVHPHFLFNTLNNIAVLSEKYPDKVTNSIIQLSKVLRYQLYDGNKEFIQLNKEIENLRNYLELEKIRMNKSWLHFEITGNPASAAVSPFLFLPFVENSIKHGINAQGETSIAISFEILSGTIIFCITNEIPSIKPVHISGGIGLSNIKRRLELLYPKQHELSIEQRNNKYCVKLILKNISNEMYHS